MAWHLPFDPRWDLALELLERLQQEGLKPTTACFNSAIISCTQGGWNG